MEITVKGKNIDVGDALRKHVAGELESTVGKYFSRALEATVTISREAYLFRANISVHPVRGMLVQSHATADDPWAVFDTALERIAKQLRRYKRRISSHHKRRGAEEVAPAEQVAQYVIAAENEDEELAEEAQPAIIAETTTEISTLTVSEAVMRLDLAELPLVMFRNRASGSLNVVYRRPDGNIGWIDPSTTQQA